MKNVSQNKAIHFINKIKFAGTHECWEWLGPKSKHGYGYSYFGNKNKRVHRVFLEYHLKQEIPKNLVVDHMCRNRGCVNPNHLRVVSVSENVLAYNSQSITKILKDRTCCPNCGGPLVQMKTRKRRQCKPCDRERVRKCWVKNGHKYEARRKAKKGNK